MSFTLMFFAFVLLMALMAIVVGRMVTVLLDATVRSVPAEVVGHL